MKTKIINYTTIVLFLIAIGYIVVNGWNLSLESMESFWLQERYGITLNYKAKRLHELTPERLIIKVAKAYEIDPDQFLKIAKCENGTHEPDRKNYLWPQISASGLYMFTDSTWIATRKQMGLPDPNLALKHDNVEQAKTAAWKIANGGLGAWDASKNCWG